MRIEYAVEPRTVVDAHEASVMVADHGSFILLGAEQNISSFDGISFLDLSSYTMEKAVHGIHPVDSAAPSLRVSRDAVSRLSEGWEERFFFRDRIACYHVCGSGDVAMTFDVRDLYDLRADGRTHHLAEEHAPAGLHQFRVSCRNRSFVVLCDCEASMNDDWEKADVSFDARRGAESSWWVYDGLRLHVDKEARVVIAPAARAQEARMFFSSADLWTRTDEPLDRPLALSLATRSLHGLLTETPRGDTGILAGLPWFFQIYTRDEAIATGALLCEGQFGTAGRILLREISRILADGRVPNRFPHSQTGSADGVGWSFLRLCQLHEQAEKTLSDEQWSFVRDQLLTSLDRLRMEDGLVVNGWQETWMDTTGGYPDGREGARIEIQALTLRMLFLAERLCDGERRESLAQRRKTLIAAVRERLFDAERAMLFDGWVDGHHDGTIRPNALLAHYIFPDLLSPEEWSVVAKNLLSQLTTPWGGLSSIDREHVFFHGSHTGMDDRSYHRGDAWYFVDNLVAISLLRIDPSFRPLAERLYASSVKDLLMQGAAGHCSEISSADRQEPFGCWCQAWSASTLIELHHALHPPAS